MRIGKRGLLRVSLISALLVLIILILFLQPNISAAENYQVGDKIKLELDGFGKYNIKIVSPSGTSVAKDKIGSLVFRPPEEGDYKVIVEGEKESKIFEFTVGNSSTKVETQNILVPIDEISKDNLEQPIQEEAKEPEFQPSEPKKKRNGQIRVGEPVKWVESLEVVSGEKTSLDLKSLTDATIYQVGEEASEDSPIQETKTPIENTENLEGKLEIEYTTPAPQKQEKTISKRKKEVIVYSPPDQDYQNVVSYTTIPEFTSHKELITVYWKEQDQKIQNFEAKDTDGNGLLDYVEWVVPHLSNQTFDISIDILNVQSYPTVGGNWSVRFLTSGKADLKIRAFNGTTWTNDPSDPENYDLRFLRLTCDGQPIDYQWSDWTGGIIVDNWQCEEIGLETSKVLTSGVHNLEFCFGGVCEYAHNLASDPEYRLVGEWGHAVDIQQNSWMEINFTHVFDDIPVVVHHLEADYNYNSTPCQTRITNVTRYGFLIRSENWSSGTWAKICPSSGLNSYWVAMEKGIHNLTNNGAITRKVEVTNFTMSSAACGRSTDWTWSTNWRNFTTAWSFEPLIIPAIQTAYDEDPITWYARGCTITTGDEWTNTCAEIGLSGLELNSTTISPCALHTVSEEGGYIAWQMNADWTNAESRDNSGTFGAYGYLYYWEAFWESNSARGSGNDPYPMSAYYVTLSQTWNDGAAWWSPNSINSAEGWLETLDFDAATNRVYELADEDNNFDGEQSHATENGNTLFFNSSSGFLFSNISVDNAPPRWLNISANDTNPSINQYVNFSSAWFDPGKMGTWTLYWDIGSGFVPATSGTFRGMTNETASTEMQIPSNTEGTTITYYFRATDFYGKENQTSSGSIQVKDRTPPTIRLDSISPTTINYGEQVTIQANVSDTTGISKVWAQISPPNNIALNQTMSNISYGLFQINYTSTQVGAYNATIFANDTNGYAGDSTTLLQWNVTGWANNSISFPSGGAFNYSLTIPIYCRVLDANQSTQIQNYPVRFFINNNLIGTNTTNSSGIAIYWWNVSGITSAQINCTIEDNATLFYNANIKNSNTAIEVLAPNITLTNLTHFHQTRFSLNEFETRGYIEWVNVTVRNRGNTSAQNVYLNLTLLYPNFTLAAWFPSSIQNCSTLQPNQECTKLFNNSNALGYFINSTIGGTYYLNTTINWTNGGLSPSTNLTEIRVYNMPDNFTGYLTDAEIPAGANTSYSFNITNPWSRNLTLVNVTINCPTVAGMRCFSSTNNNTNIVYLGNISNWTKAVASFNITTNSTVPVNNYLINITLVYINPANEIITYREYNTATLVVRPLLAVISNYPNSIIRGTSVNFTGYGHNIGASSISNVNLTWRIPLNWRNTTGSLFNSTTTLGANAKLYTNITILIYQNATLGPQIINLTSVATGIISSVAVQTINVTALTYVSQVFVNKSTPLRNEPVTIVARLIYDNGTVIQNQNITFQQNLTAVTNATGYAVVQYTIPSNAPTGTGLFPINVTYFGNSTLYTLLSSNVTNITVTDTMPISQNSNPQIIGYGLNVTINATIVSTSQIDKVIANITSPSGKNYLLFLINISQNDFVANFSETWTRGRYNYTIWANNSAGFVNQTTTPGYFLAESNLTISLMTDKDGYVRNEIVNLTDIAYSPVSLNVKAESGQIIVAAGSTSNIASLANTYQLNRSFIITGSQIRNTATDAPNQRLGRMYFSSIINGLSSQLTADRASGTNTMRSTYSIIQAENIDVCHVSQTIPDSTTSQDVSLAGCSPALPSNYQEKCFVSSFQNARANSGTDTCSEEQMVMASITSTTNLNLQRAGGACGATDVQAQVVCFNDGTNVTALDTGQAHFSSSFATAIGHTIDLTKSWLIYSCQSLNQNGAEHTTVECYFSTDSQVTCRTSSLGTTENSLQQCVMYVVEFYDARNAEVNHHIPTDTEVGNGLALNTTVSTIKDMSRAISTCAYSIRNSEGNSYSQGNYPCYILNDQTITCEHGQVTSNNPSHDFHCQIIEWPNETIRAHNPTYVNNFGSTGISAPMLMTAQSNSSGIWRDIGIVINDTATGKRRQLNSAEIFNLTEIWNGPGEGSGFNTASNPGGSYRAFVTFMNPTGGILVDGSGNNLSGYYPFEIDFRPPTVNLIFPANDTINYGTKITVNFTASDASGVDTCSLFHNKSGFFTLEQTEVYDQGNINAFTISGFTQNSYIKWNVQCNDSVGNIGFTAKDIYFYLIVPPDFMINNSDIGINLLGVIEGTNVTINATVYNLGGQNGTTVVQFFDGDPDLGGIQISGNTSISIAAEGGKNITRVNWTAAIGPHNIFVVLDPPLSTNGSVVEINETNNEANKSIDVTSWQTFYGNATINKLLATQNLANISLWSNETNLAGTIFVTDTESSINWFNLAAIGKNTVGGNAVDDFSDIDSLLNTTSFADSVNNTFVLNGQPRATSDFVIRGQTIANVPVVNSSSTGSFLTGMLWDKTKNTNSEFDTANKEDIIIATKFNKSKAGKYGTYDYEIQVPVRLRQYYTTESSNIYFYFELN